jgi:hypothetical protein
MRRIFGSGLGFVLGFVILLIDNNVFCQENCKVVVLNGEIFLDKDAIGQANHLRVTPTKNEQVQIKWLQHDYGSGRYVYFQNPVRHHTHQLLIWHDKLKEVNAVLIVVDGSEVVYRAARIDGKDIVPLSDESILLRVAKICTVTCYGQTGTGTPNAPPCFVNPDTGDMICTCDQNDCSDRERCVQSFSAPCPPRTCPPVRRKRCWFFW